MNIDRDEHARVAIHRVDSLGRVIAPKVRLVHKSGGERPRRLASRRMTIAKVGGVAADVVVSRLRAWAVTWTGTDPDEWASNRGTPLVRAQVNDFADRMREYGCSLPAVHFIKWSDPWSMDA